MLDFKNINPIIAPTAESIPTETMAHPPSPLADPKSQPQLLAIMADLQKAVGLHQHGQLDQAAAAYRSVLERAPGQFDALHMLGVLEAQRGNSDTAVDLIRRAIAIDPNNPAAHNNCGNVLRDLKRPDEALASFERALALKPDYAPALNNRGSALCDLNRTVEALSSFERALALNPDNIETMNNRGNALRVLGRPEEALASYDRALALRPANAEIFNNRGNTLRDLGRAEDALASYDRALTLKPDYAEANYNRGNALRDLERYEEALASYDRALALKPDHAEAFNNRGLTLRALNRLDEALTSCDRALALDSDNPDFLISRGHTLSELKRYPDAIASYRLALAQGGNEELLRYYLAALGAEPPPPTPPQSYVEGLFDQYATRFDDALQSLKYTIPEQLYNAVVAVRPNGKRDIADLGCGTGMCGFYFRAIAQSLVGVDIAENMIEKSRQRGVYDRLVKASLTEFLRDNSASFDLVVAADVFIYVGDVDAVFAATHAALRPGGQFAFSVESEEGDGFSLRPSRRYAHSLGYLRGLAAKHGFAEKTVIPVAIREEHGQNIPGFNVIFERERA